MDCYTSALRILAYRFNSEGELRRKLRAKKFEKSEIDEAIDRLRGEKWLDDDRFAAAFVRTRLRRRIGSVRIRQELIAAGVANDVIDRALEANSDEEGERESLEKLVAKRMQLVIRRHGEEYAASSQGRQKIAAWLVKQGYEPGEVFEALRARR
jgi:regulatory protein